MELSENKPQETTPQESNITTPDNIEAEIIDKIKQTAKAANDAPKEPTMPGTWIEEQMKLEDEQQDGDEWRLKFKGRHKKTCNCSRCVKKRGGKKAKAQTEEQDHNTPPEDLKPAIDELTEVLSTMLMMYSLSEGVKPEQLDHTCFTDEQKKMISKHLPEAEFLQKKTWIMYTLVLASVVAPKYVAIQHISKLNKEEKQNDQTTNN